MPCLEVKLNEYILVLITVPNKKVGEKIAEGIVNERLAACVTISASSQSYYWWQGEISKDQEHILFIKTRTEYYHKLEKKILDIHPYDVPEIIALPIIKASQKYLDWITKETK